MTVRELQKINQVIKRETLAYCGDVAPTLDEIDFLCGALSLYAFMFVSKPELIADYEWERAVGNTIRKIILENF